MVKPFGTTMYPGDAAILEEIETALASGKRGSRTDAIRPFLPQLEGASDEAKIKRMLRGLKRRQSAKDDRHDLARALRGLSPEQKAAHIADLELRAQILQANLAAIVFDLKARGIELDSDTKRSILEAEIWDSLQPPKKKGR